MLFKLEEEMVLIINSKFIGLSLSVTANLVMHLNRMFLCVRLGNYFDGRRGRGEFPGDDAIHRRVAECHRVQVNRVARTDEHHGIVGFPCTVQ